MLNAWLDDQLNVLRENHLHRVFRDVETPQGVRLRVNGRQILNFSSNDYLGLANDPRLKEAAIKAIQEEGVGSGASRLISGHMSSHRKLERLLADFKGTEDALVFSTGYMTNVGIISALMGRDDVIVSDKLNHASIVDGMVLSRAEIVRYTHNDMTSLESSLQRYPLNRRKMIVTDTVFSMDGDTAPLKDIVALAERYQAFVMTDEAHGFGVLGKNGKGLVEHLGLDGKVDIQMGTLSKAAGCLGGYVCGSKALKEYLLNASRSFVYTTALPPMVAATAARAVEIIRDEPQRREHLWRMTQYARQELQRMGFDTMKSETPIIPMLIGESNQAVVLAKQLFDAGFWVAAIRPPTVPQKTARLRLTITAAHTQSDIDQLLEQLQRTGRDLCLI